MSFKNFKDYLAERAKYPHGVTTDDSGIKTANALLTARNALEGKGGKKGSKPTYHAPGANKNPGLMTADGPDRGTPFGSHASPGLTPQNSAPYGQKPADKTKKVGGKKKKKLPGKKAMKTEQFLHQTRDLSDVQFTKEMLKEVRDLPTPAVKDLYGREFVPEPAQTMKYVAHMMLTNETIMRRMVRELKRNGGLALLLSEVLQHPETYEQLTEAINGSFGDLAQRKLNLLIEEVSAPRVGGGGTQGGAFGGGGAGMGGGGGAPQGGAFGGGGAGMGGGGGGGGAAAGGAGGMQGMGEEEMMPGMGGGEGGDMGGMGMGGGDEGGEHGDHDDMEDDADMHDDDDEMGGDDEGEEEDDDDDEDLADDDEDDHDDSDEDEHGEGDEEDDHHHDPDEDPQGAGMGMGGMGGGGGMGGPGGM